MPTGPEFTIGTDAGESDSRDRDEHSRGRRQSAASRGDGPRLSRRHALAAVGTLSIGSMAGCLDSALNIADGQNAVSPEPPGDDPDGTPGEFYYLLEQNDVTVDELYHDTEDDSLSLFYESNAETEAESDDEIGMIYQVFSGGLIARGSDIENLYTEVVDGFEGQVAGWGIQTEWVEMHQSGEITDRQLWGTIAETKTYGEGAGDNDDTDDAADGNTIDDEEHDGGD